MMLFVVSGSPDVIRVKEILRCNNNKQSAKAQQRSIIRAQENDFLAGCE
jgi:hypothetical protein